MGARVSTNTFGRLRYSSWRSEGQSAGQIVAILQKFWEVGKSTDGNHSAAYEASGGQNGSGLRQRREFGSTSVQF
jgi:hypothetical protein